MFPESDELVVPVSRGKLIALVLASALSVSVSAWFGLFAPVESVVARTIALAGVALFLLCGAYAISRLVRPTPALIINREGILDNASALSVGFLGWDEIAELNEYQFRDQTFLGIVPKNLDALLLKQPAWKRVAIRGNLSFGAAPVNIPQVMLPLKVSALIDEIELRFRRR